MSIHLLSQAVNTLLLHNFSILSSYLLMLSPLPSNCLHFSPHLDETALVGALPKSWWGITIRMDHEPLATTYPYFLVCLFLNRIQTSSVLMSSSLFMKNQRFLINNIIYTLYIILLYIIGYITSCGISAMQNSLEKRL